MPCISMSVCVPAMDLFSLCNGSGPIPFSLLADHIKLDVMSGEMRRK